MLTTIELPEEVIHFELPEAVQSRLQFLLDKQDQGEELSLLYNPRKELWRDHFQWDGVRLVGITTVGRATIAALVMNRPAALLIREEESYRGRHPYP